MTNLFAMNGSRCGSQYQGGSLSDDTPSQYTDPTSTRRRICECIDNFGPMTLAALTDELGIDRSSIRIQARKAEIDGYLLISLVKITPGCGRAQHRYSRTSIDLPELPFAPCPVANLEAA
jgi:predicted ArsR family transcriptional regulator